MISPKPECFYRHKTTGATMAPATFNYKCPYAEMDQWEYCWPDGRAWTAEDHERAKEGMIRFLNALDTGRDSDEN